MVSEDEKTEKDESEVEKQISRQPTFSSFTPQPKDDTEYAKESKTNLGEKIEEKPERESEGNLSYSEQRMTPLLSSISGPNVNMDLSSTNFNAQNGAIPDSVFRYSDSNTQHLFGSGDIKNYYPQHSYTNFALSSEGSKKYRSPTFEAISEEENNMSHCIVDSPANKRLSMDIDQPEKAYMKRATKRPPSIHAALSPELSLNEKEIVGQNPRILVAHYESLINSLKKDYENIYTKNEDLEEQIQKLKTQVSDSNKLLLKVQEEKESDKMKFLEILNKINNNKGTRNNPEQSTLKKHFTLEMSSNQTSEEDLHKNSRNNNQSSEKTLNGNGNETLSYLTLSNNISQSASPFSESNAEEMRSKLFKLRASVKQKEELIYSLKNLNLNLQTELKTQKELEDQTKTELIQHKQKRKECEGTLKELRLEHGQDKVKLRKFTNDNENLQSELDEAKENYNYLQNDMDDLKRENARLKEQNFNLDKDKHILQSSVDKLNRMLNKTETDSQRYKSVVDLQKSALNDLQKDYNKVIIDLSQHGIYHDMQVKRMSDSIDMKEKTFSNTVLEHTTNKSSPHMRDITNFNSCSDTRSAMNQSRMNKYHSSLFNEYTSAKDPQRRQQNLSNQFSDASKECELGSKNYNIMERTFDHQTYHQRLEKPNHLCMTEAQDSKKKSVISKYIPQIKPHALSRTVESKRASTEQLVEVSPGNCSSEIITDKSDSFVSNSTIINSPGLNLESDQKTVNRNSKMKRSQSRRESRVLIQPLPRLFTQSKYQEFRQAKSTERKQVQSVKSRMVSARSQYSILKDVGDDRETKVSFRKQEQSNPFNCTLRSPQTTSAHTKYSKVDINPSVERTRDKNTNKFSNRDSMSSVQSQNYKFSGKSSKSSKKSTILYPSVNYKTTMEVINDCSKESQLRTLQQHLNVISERKDKLVNEVIAIDKILNENKKISSKSKSSRNTQRGRYNTSKFMQTDSLKAAEATMNNKRKEDLQKELDTLAKSIKNVKTRIKNFNPL